MWDPCCSLAPDVADCMYVYSLPVFICGTLSLLPPWPSVLSHRRLRVFSSLTMSLPKCVRTLHDRLKIIQEVEKNPGEKRVDNAKWLRLPASTLNSLFAKKNKIREQIQKCGNACKKRKTGKESTFAELDNIPKTDSLCYYVLIVMEVTNKCRLWSGNPRNQGASRTLKIAN
jgi:hypothetical protein